MLTWESERHNDCIRQYHPVSTGQKWCHCVSSVTRVIRPPHVKAKAPLTPLKLFGFDCKSNIYWDWVDFDMDTNWRNKIILKEFSPCSYLLGWESRLLFQMPRESLDCKSGFKDSETYKVLSRKIDGTLLSYWIWINTNSGCILSPRDGWPPPPPDQITICQGESMCILFHSYI